MTHEVVIAGFGGQGVMLIGEILAYAGMLEGKNVSWMPSYGPEMRGGTANCSVVVSDQEVGSPVVAEPTGIIAMNGPSLDKFEGSVRPGGLIVANLSLINRKVKREDVKVIEVPANDVAVELGNFRVANMVALGALLGATRCVSKASVLEALRHMLSGHRQDLIPLNEKALNRGIEIALASGHYACAN
ncbi:Pyruvate-flavodoxin oxidoreductase, central domain [Moorella glycerini]|uniref:NADH-dependent phenylglyoxylate dehydrogenase subunit gamma n=1 Tax=Neomoorella stamsii TaxID=1266720 RepID=A0A9X7J3I5_9FIRM|nr:MULTISPECIES: 2-oxoacid:acceptor oxidoreductase family protein [Moorella]PRR73967.1 NADH-dependent phenylglyoxylate dehydrogenase subunit gamma [Moorella stamsii]CEP66178.1 Pyruvate-flavodoxin oxidoreductase, central domain [Moorella glycerini]